MGALLKSVEEVRNQFPFFKQDGPNANVVYLDSAATTQKPVSVINRISTFYESEYATVHRGVYSLSQRATQLYDNARKTAQKFINAKNSDEIIFVGGTTEAINLVAHCLGELLQPGDEIIVSEVEHHANFVPWQQLAKAKGLKLIVSPVNDAGEFLIDEFEKRLSKRTKLVAVAHVSNVLGSIFPVTEIVKRAHSVGAKVLLDGAQAIQHLSVDVQGLDCDFYAFSGHKLYGPTGIGVLYAKSEMISEMPPYKTGGDMIERVSITETTFMSGAAKFEAGTPNFVDAIALGSAIDFFKTIEPAFLKAHENELLNYATNRLKSQSDIQIIGTAKNKISVLSFVMEGVHPHDVGTVLDSEGICVRVGHHCSQLAMARFKIPATIRASFGIYNNLADVDRLMDGLDMVRKVMK